jgi:glucuronate isomerase
MKPLSHADLLMTTDLARELYHEHAASLPIIDYHSHLDAQALASNRRFSDLTELWITPDQYKHRAMRMLGVAESSITGNATAREKFDSWAACVPGTVGHPLYLWSATELETYFGIVEPLTPESAPRIWDETRRQLSAPTHSARGLLAATQLETACTSDRLLDDLSAHEELARSDFHIRILPSLRADDAFALDTPGYRDWVRALGVSTDLKITDLDSFLVALSTRLDTFAAHGCFLSDHGIDVFQFAPAAPSVAAGAWIRLQNGHALTPTEDGALRAHLLSFFAAEYARRGWVMQLHLGAQRYTSSRLRRLVGATGGFATIGATTDLGALCRFLDQMEDLGALPKTILYTLNPAEYHAFAALTGSFTEEGTAGKIQFGPAWWFNDHALGIRNHLDALSNYGLMSTFIGMTTDSRSLLSLIRHDYFRRVLCEWIGTGVRSGQLPRDVPFLARLVRQIAYENARSWLPVNSLSTS